LRKDNIIIITGGCVLEDGCYSYDYDMNYLCELNNMSEGRQMHSMVNIDEYVYAIGGLGVKSVECFNLDYETWDRLPDLNYDRKDPGVCVVNGNILYVFMGYSQTVSDICKNFERYEINVSNKWDLLPVNDYVGYKLRTSCAVLAYDSGFLIIGGFAAASESLNSVCYFDIDDYTLKRSNYKLPFTAAFSEKSMFTFNDNDFYLFSYATMKLITFDVKMNSLSELR
jgi:hypothetical protein